MADQLRATGPAAWAGRWLTGRGGGPARPVVCMMVMGAGGYRSGDYWRYGVPVLGWFLVVTLTVVPPVWQF
ncbi:hypothetical protein [Kitasatospora indigofera]|uniref:hypothetical protein n=1 Tax=Kitasatospora indigofera TaxID=67307 RepID=UPI0033B1E7DC